MSLSLEQATGTCKSLEVLFSQAINALLRHGTISLCSRQNKFGHSIKFQITRLGEYIFDPFGKSCDGLVVFVDLLTHALNLMSPSGQDILLMDRLSTYSEDVFPDLGNLVGASAITHYRAF